MTTDKVVCGVDLADLLFGCTDEIPCCHRNQPWTPFNDTCNVADTSDLLDALFLKSESSSAVASPLWSPCTTDSSTTEDPPTDPTESFPSSFCAGFPIADTPSFPPSLECQPAPAQKNPYVSIDLGWESCHLQQDFGIAYYLSKTQASPLSPHQPLTVKDLLLSNLGKTGQQIPQHSPQELILNEDEKKLLAKEGVKLPGKLPLSKLEERVLKKIRRKIRNKRSAQESRKKRREYVDDLEGRMSACSANNLELQRKIQRLEETNKFCFFHFPCSFPQVSSQNPTASWVVQNTPRPKWFPAPCRLWRRCEVPPRFLPSPSQEDLRTAQADRSRQSGLLILSHTCRTSFQMSNLIVRDSETVPSWQICSSRCKDLKIFARSTTKMCKHKQSADGNHVLILFFVRSHTS
ncbi:cyclic AMP-responsive element-binding protein 3-like protein 3-A isoform X1 [Takifugu flavidus]|uniref:cyclic AMP-responsive element-binding protein 3-like protein 3-A isoform X1 n=1 Tax=Takifugu flavidus TaxID=433684 RepID=UPI0025447D76|nr:cyclic AMP-responsive element-binding protein 3-like protein 3-A isoform X1 [Takifugu flavidus]